MGPAFMLQHELEALVEASVRVVAAAGASILSGKLLCLAFGAPSRTEDANSVSFNLECHMISTLNAKCVEHLSWEGDPVLAIDEPRLGCHGVRHLMGDLQAVNDTVCGFPNMGESACGT